MPSRMGFGDVDVFVPPKFNYAGNRQLWFYETGNHNIDHFGNGILSGLVLFTPLVAVVGAL